MMGNKCEFCGEVVDGRYAIIKTYGFLNQVGQWVERSGDYESLTQVCFKCRQDYIVIGKHNGSRIRWRDWDEYRDGNYIRHEK